MNKSKIIEYVNKVAIHFLSAGGDSGGAYSTGDREVLQEVIDWLKVGDSYTIDTKEVETEYSYIRCLQIVPIDIEDLF